MRATFRCLGATFSRDHLIALQPKSEVKHASRRERDSVRKTRTAALGKAVCKEQYATDRPVRCDLLRHGKSDPPQYRFAWLILAVTVLILAGCGKRRLAEGAPELPDASSAMCGSGTDGGSSCEPTDHCSGHDCGEPSTCSSGQLGCGCKPGRVCDEFAGEATLCSDDGQCVMAKCDEATSGCSCKSQRDCEQEAVCRRSVCVPVAARIAISGDVRACDIVLEDESRSIANVSFDARVRGATARDRSRVAVSFIARSDSAVSGDSVTLEGVRGELELQSARCYDHLGREQRVDLALH